MKTRLGIPALTIAGLLTLAGCSIPAPIADGASDAGAQNSDAGTGDGVTPSAAPTPEAPAIKDLVVAEKGYGRDGDTYWYGLVLQNPNADYIWTFADVTVEAVDAEGTILDSDSNYMTLLAGSWNVTGTFFDIGSGKVDHLEVRGPVAADATYQDGDAVGAFTFSDVKFTKDKYGYGKVTGKVSSSFVEDQESVRLDIILRAGGKIVGTDATFVDRVPSGGKAAFEASFLSENLPKGTKATVTATP